MQYCSAYNKQPQIENILLKQKGGEVPETHLGYRVREASSTANEIDMLLQDDRLTLFSAEIPLSYFVANRSMGPHA